MQTDKAVRWIIWIHNHISLQVGFDIGAELDKKLWSSMMYNLVVIIKEKNIRSESNKQWILLLEDQKGQRRSILY